VALRHFLPVFLLVGGALHAQDFTDVKVERLASGYQFAEGPVWSYDGYLIFSDIPAGKLYKWVPGAKPVVYRADSHHTNGNTFDTHGRLYSCETGLRRITRTERSGRITVVADKFLGKRFNETNDIVVRKDGNVYFTDPAFGSADELRDLPYYAVFHIDAKGYLEVVAKPKGRPNGITLSPDQKTLYVTNSDEKNLRAYDLGPAGEVSNERVLISGIKGVPDGVKTDENGNLYVAAAALEIYTAAGKHLNTLEMAEKPSNLAFGEPDFQTLFVTARTAVYRIRLNTKGALPY
jgi:gluconolactonase